MFTTVVMKEIRLNVISFRFQVSMTLFFVLILGSMFMMSNNYQRRRQDFDVERVKSEEDVAKMMHPSEFMAFGRTWPQKPRILGIFSSGLEKELTRPVTFSLWKEIQLGSAPYSNTIFVLFQTPDFVYVVNIVMSLLAILFAFDAVSGEKENQTLKLMLTNAVPRDVVLLGKWVGGLLTIWIPFLFAVGLGIVIMRTVTKVPLTPDDWKSIAMIVGLSLIYVAVFFGLGMLFSASAARSSTSLILSLFAWVFFVLVVPNVAPIIARKTVQLPSPGKLQLIRTEIEHEVQTEMRKQQKQGRDAYKDFEAEVNKRFRGQLDNYDKKLDAQARMARTIARFSPSSNYIFAASEIAGTGISEFNRLKKSIRVYRDWFMGKDGAFAAVDENRIRQKYPNKAVMPAVDADVFKNKQFRVQETTLAGSMVVAMWDIIILFAYLGIIFLVTYVQFMRYDVR